MCCTQPAATGALVPKGLSSCERGRRPSGPTCAVRGDSIARGTALRAASLLKPAPARSSASAAMDASARGGPLRAAHALPYVDGCESPTTPLPPPASPAATASAALAATAPAFAPAPPPPPRPARVSLAVAPSAATTGLLLPGVGRHRVVLLPAGDSAAAALKRLSAASEGGMAALGASEADAGDDPLGVGGRGGAAGRAAAAAHCPQRLSVGAPPQGLWSWAAAGAPLSPISPLPLGRATLSGAPMASLHSLRLEDALTAQGAWAPSLDAGDAASRASVRSLASIGMGSTDGRRLTVRRVPTSPGDLLNLAQPTDDELSDSSSSSGSWGVCPGLDGEGSTLGGGSTRGSKRSKRAAAAEAWRRRPLKRQHWANKAQFVLACIGYSVGLGNVWRFPYLCYKAGGGVFLVPYLLILVVCGVPLLYMELAIGQFTRRGPIGALGQLCPIFKGAGLASVVISFLMSTYYNVIIAYALYYFFSAFRADVPWASCGHSWNTPQCWRPGDDGGAGGGGGGDAGGGAGGDRNASGGGAGIHSRPKGARTPSEEFYDNKVLQISAGLEQLGGVRWELAACLLCAWVLVYFSLWKGVRSSGRVLYFTATFPYLVILVFLARALTLDGADVGLRYFFKPEWSQLADAKVWVSALAQNFNSFGVAFGSVISFASYNRFHNQILVDALAVAIVNAFTSILVGIFAFATIGNIASEMDKHVQDVVADGPGLVFVVYPQAMTKMPAIQLWGVLFFFMLLCLALNSQFAIVEVVVTSLQDGFPLWVRRKLRRHEVLVLFVCAVSFIFGLPNITEGGMYLFQLVDHFAASISIMYLAFFECIAVAWLYGARRLARDVRSMTGRRPSLYLRFCWWGAAPMLLLFVWVFSLIDYEAPTYNNGAYHYPAWAEALGWAVASLSLACIPVCAVAVVARAPGDTLLQKIRAAVRPRVLQCEVCGGGGKCARAAATGTAAAAAGSSAAPSTPRANGRSRCQLEEDEEGSDCARELSTLITDKEVSSLGPADDTAPSAPAAAP